MCNIVWDIYRIYVHQQYVILLSFQVACKDANLYTNIQIGIFFRFIIII